MKNWQKILLAVDGSGTSARTVHSLCNIAPLMKDAEISGEVVLEARKQGAFGTVGAEKGGVSRLEEFLFGSISKALAWYSKEVPSWIVG